MPLTGLSLDNFHSVPCRPHTRPWMARSALRAIAPLAGLAVASVAAHAEPLMFQPANSNWTRIESIITDEPPQNLEAADDFNVEGLIERVVVTGQGCFSCLTPTVEGVWVRFYEWTATGPGVMQYETFVPAGSADLVYAPSDPSGFDITLESPFEAFGQHFVSVQVEMQGAGYWGWWMSNHNAPLGSPFRYRDRALGDEANWGSYIDGLNQPVISDLAFTLYGQAADGGIIPTGCGTWTEQQLPTPPFSSHAVLRDIHGTGPDDVWAVGEFYYEPNTIEDETRTLAYHYDGASWSIVPTPSPAPYIGGGWAGFEAVHALAPDNVWAAGGARVQALPSGFVGTHLLVAHWDGSSWTQVNTGIQAQSASGEQVRDILAFADDDIWFFGDWVGPQTGLAVHYDGGDFTRIPMPLLIGSGHGIEAADGTSSNDIWAVGGGGDGDDVDFSNIFHWDGSQWSHVPGPTPGWFQRLYDVQVLGPDDVWASGTWTDAAGYHLLLLHWDGSEWTQFADTGGGGGIPLTFADGILRAVGSVNSAVWTGSHWKSEVMLGNENVDGPSMLSAFETGPCTIWGAGRKIVGGQIQAFVSRLEEIGSTLPGDVTGDGAVDFNDLNRVLAHFGTANLAGDANSDGITDFADLNLVLSNWGG